MGEQEKQQTTTGSKNKPQHCLSGVPFLLQGLQGLSALLCACRSSTRNGQTPANLLNYCASLAMLSCVCAGRSACLSFRVFALPDCQRVLGQKRRPSIVAEAQFVAHGMRLRGGNCTHRGISV